jgi:N-acetyl-gamma-glutamyl-phosphate reductase
MTKRVFIDGHAGTTGLRIREWLAARRDIELLTPSDAERKSVSARRAFIAEADLAILCLPDDAAREAAAWADASGTRVLDASTAHRVGDGWVYGLPELEPGQRERIRVAPRVSNPGCYPSAFVLLVRPLIDAGLLAADSPLGIHALSGYSGGGRPMIERWEDPANGLASLPFEAPYALDRSHKHIPEMVRYARLRLDPQFVPAVGPFACGMRVEVPLHAALISAGTTGKPIWEALAERYRGEPFVHVHPIEEPESSHEYRLDPRACNDTNRIELRVIPHPSGHCLLVGVLDNLGKGAAGVAIQNLNLMLGIDETTGLPA